MTYKFWTMTDETHKERGSVPARFRSKELAVKAAITRINNKHTESVCIMECVQVVRRKETPISVEDVTFPEPTPPDTEYED